MPQVFADTSYFVALSLPYDRQHARALAVSRDLPPGTTLLTTDEVLVEYLNFLSGRGSALRAYGAGRVEDLLSEDTVEVVPYSRERFLAGFALWRSRLDKAYSLTDCISFELMRTRDLTDALTHDHHFTQEGFTALLRLP